MHLGDLVAAGEPAVERLHQIVALLGRNRRDEVLPVIREQPAGPFLIEPGQVFRPAEEDATQDQRVHVLGKGLGIGQ